MCCQQQAKSQLSYRDLKSSVQLKKKSTCLEILKQNSQGKKLFRSINIFIGNIILQGQIQAYLAA